jgi:LPS export ABC transporter protein LptC
MRSVADRARFLTQRVITFAALFAGGAILIGTLVGREDNSTETEARPAERGYYVTDATLTELGQDGKPRVVVHARSIEQQLADQSVLLSDLNMDYTTPNLGVWHLTAAHGHMPSDRQSVQLFGDVRVTGSADRAGGKAIILTDKLNYDTQSNIVQTAEPVSIEFGPHLLHGRGLRAELNDGTLQLESNVNGRFIAPSG